MKNRTYYFVSDIISIKSFDPNNFKIDEKSHEIILLYYVEYVMIKEYVKIYCVNPLYLNFKNVN